MRTIRRRIKIGFVAIFLPCIAIAALCRYIEDTYQYGHFGFNPNLHEAIKVVNDTGGRLPFYSESGPNRVLEGYIENGQILTYGYQGSTGQYTYALVSGEVYQFRKSLNKGILLFDRFIPTRTVFDWMFKTSVYSVLLCLLILSSLKPFSMISTYKNNYMRDLRRMRSNTDQRITMVGRREPQEMATIKRSGVVHAIGKRLFTMVKSDKRRPDTNEKQNTDRDDTPKTGPVSTGNMDTQELQRLKEEVERKAQENDYLNQQLTSAVHEKSELEIRFNHIWKDKEEYQVRQDKLESLLKEYEDKLLYNDVMHQEFRTQKEIEVSDLRQSLNVVQCQIDKWKEHIRVLGADVDDKKYDGVIKGRQFELYVAENLRDRLGCEILEWTPDKGALYKIWTRQDGNPDLLLKSPSGKVFAVECKYRSRYVWFKSEGGTGKEYWGNWATSDQSNRYRSFGCERKSPVYIAMGLKGTAEDPERCLVMPLDHVHERSTEKTIQFGDSKSDVQLCFKAKEFHSESYCAKRLGWSGLIDELQ